MKKILLIFTLFLFWGCEKIEFPSYPNWLFQGKWQLVDIVATNSVTKDEFHLDSALISESTIQTYGDTLKLKKDFTNATIENKLKKFSFWEFVMMERFKILVNPKDGLDGRKTWENEIPVNFHMNNGNYVGFKMQRNGHLYTFNNKNYLTLTISAPKVVTMVRRNGNVEIFVSEYTTLIFHNK